MAAEQEVADTDEVLVTDEEQIERLKQKLEEGALGPYAFNKEFTKYHRRLTGSSRSLQRGWGQSSMSLTRQNTHSVDYD
jgi:hypothetical protein